MIIVASLLQMENEKTLNFIKKTVHMEDKAEYLQLF